MVRVSKTARVITILVTLLVNAKQRVISLESKNCKSYNSGRGVFKICFV